MGLPKTRVSIPFARRYAASDRPYGPAPMIATVVIVLTGVLRAFVTCIASAMECTISLKADSMILLGQFVGTTCSTTVPLPWLLLKPYSRLGLCRRPILYPSVFIG